METLTLTLPLDLRRRLQQKARETGKQPERLALEILEQVLSPESPITPRSSIEVFASLGRLSSLSPQLQKRIIPGVTLKEVQDALSKAKGKPLSEIIIEQRGPRDA